MTTMCGDRDLRNSNLHKEPKYIRCGGDKIELL